MWSQIRYTLPLWLVMLLTSWLPDNRVTIKFRGFLASFFIGKCGSNFQIGRDVVINSPRNMVIGNDVYIAKGTWLNAKAGLTLEDEVMLAPYVVISTLQHTYESGSYRFAKSTTGKVRIGRGSWLAAHSSVKCGVSIGKGNLIAANAFVVRDTIDNVILGGVPAKVINIISI